MKKVRSNALWNELSSEQLNTLDKWLFEENQSYPDAWQRAKTEFGYKGSESSVRRYYAWRRKERTLEEFKDLRDEVADISNAPEDAASLRTASMKLLVQNDYNEVLREAKEKEEKLRRELKAEDHKIRREAMKFAKEKFQFDTMRRALRALPQLIDLAEAKRNPNIKRYEENAYWNELRRAMYGPGRKVHPESAQEEAEMLAAKRERAEAAGEELEPEEEERIIDAQPPTPSSPSYEEYMAEKAKREAKEDKNEDGG